MSVSSRRSTAFAIALVLAPFAGPVWAQGAPPSDAHTRVHNPHRFRERFDAANTTHDGRLTLAQAEAGRMRMVARNFDAIDSDHKGYVTLGDVRTFNRARRAAGAGQTPDAPARQEIGR